MSEIGEKCPSTAISDLQAENKILKDNLKATEEQLTVERRRNIQLYINNEQLILINGNLLQEIAYLNHNIEQFKNEVDELAQDILKVNQSCKSRNNNPKVSNLVSLNKELTAKNANLQITVESLKNDLIKQENLRRILYNTIQDLKGNIRVFCRIRPPLLSKANSRNLYIYNILNDNYLEIQQSINNGKSHRFYFDHIFPPQSTQSEIFEEIAQLIQSALDGYNISILTYGQTGSGKTFTIQGTRQHPGIIPRTIREIFNLVKNLATTDWYYRIDVSFMEIYNEIIYDLLETTNHCEICSNEINGVSVKNLTIKTIQTVQEFENLSLIAGRNCKIAATDMNENSSRSHTILKIYLNGVNSNNNRKQSTITLVDLAGSETTKFHNNYNYYDDNNREVQRLKETKNINKSLSALGNVILALFNNEQHIPYRNSKLTFLLQSSLGGDSKTLMFVNISPFQYCFTESLNTLRFATKVRQVKNSNKKHQI